MPAGSDLAEAQRRLTQSKTWFKRLCEKNAQAEADYRAKIERQQAELDRLKAEAR